MGKNFAPLLKGRDLDGSRESVVICDEYGPNRMLRTREWKYVQRYPNGPDELYDLVNDPQERINLTDDVEFKNRQQSMSKELGEWFQRYVIDQLDGSKLTMCRGGGQKGALRNNSHTDELFDSN